MISNRDTFVNQVQRILSPCSRWIQRRY